MSGVPHTLIPDERISARFANPKQTPSRGLNERLRKSAGLKRDPEGMKWETLQRISWFSLTLIATGTAPALSSPELHIFNRCIDPRRIAVRSIRYESYGRHHEFDSITN